MKNTKLKAIAERAASDLAGLLNDGEDKILEAWREAEEQAGDDEHPKLKLGYTVTLDLDKNHMESVLSFGIKYKLSCDSEIPDPNQVKLPLDDDDRPAVIARPVKLGKGKN